MKNMWKGLAFSAAAAMLAPGLAAAQERSVDTRQTTVARHSTNRITTLIKSEVTLREGEEAGRIVDFVVSNQGCIEFLVAENEAGYYFIPYGAARVDYQAHTVRLTVTQREFRDVIVFKGSDWPNVTDRAYQQRLHKFWGVQAARGANNADERPTNKPIPRDRDRDGNADRDQDGKGRDRDRDDDGKPNARDPNTPRDPKSPAPRDPKSPAPRDPKSPAPPAPGVEPRDPAPRPNPDAGPKPRPKPPAPSGNTGNEDPKKPRAEKP